MAWLYSGNWEGLTGSQVIRVAAALCVAVNERQEAFADYVSGSPVLTEWELSETEVIGTFPTAEEIVGASEAGALTEFQWRHLMEQLLVSVRNGVGVEWYDETGERVLNSTIVDVAEAAVVGGTLFPGEAVYRWQNASIWLAMQAALDQMYVVRKRVTVSSASTHGEARYYDWSFTESAEEVWDGMLVATPGAAGRDTLPRFSLATLYESRRSPAGTRESSAAVSVEEADTVAGGAVGVNATVPSGTTFSRCGIAYLGCGGSEPALTFLGETLALTYDQATWPIFEGYQYLWIDGPMTTDVYPMALEIPDDPPAQRTFTYDVGTGVYPSPTWDEVWLPYQEKFAVKSVEQVIFDYYRDISDELTDKS